MQQDAYLLDAASRDVVLNALRAVCVHRGWDLPAAHVRTNHVHAVVCSDAEAQRVMVDFKAYASRAMTEAGLGGRRRKRWSRHGSTRYLWKRENVSDAIAYVVTGQGDPMAVFDPSTEP